MVWGFRVEGLGFRGSGGLGFRALGLWVLGLGLHIRLIGVPIRDL